MNKNFFLIWDTPGDNRAVYSIMQTTREEIFNQRNWSFYIYTNQFTYSRVTRWCMGFWTPSNWYLLYWEILHTLKVLDINNIEKFDLHSTFLKGW